MLFLLMRAQATCDLALRFGEDDDDEDRGPQMVWLFSVCCACVCVLIRGAIA